MTIVYALASDILASGLAYNFPMPTTVPDGLWCEGRRLNISDDARAYVQLFDADDKALAVRLEPSAVKEQAGGEVGEFPAAVRA